MFVDRVNIIVKAGNGGDGSVSFYRDANTTNGGPDGGTGGRGGNIIFVASDDTNTLVEFRFNKHFRAENGERGGKKHCSGKDGKDLYIKVPRGCIIKEKDTQKIIADIFETKKEYVLLKGGFGGKGNSCYATSTRQSPGFAQQGKITEEHEITLELKTIADVGLIGFPNVGKSTLLSAISDAHPKIANYHFTTLAPNLGVVKYYDNSCVVADIPGIIEGASEGLGLGHDFLKHIERTRLLVHVVDIAGTEGRDAFEDYQIINNELYKHSPELAKRAQIIALNKCDVLGDFREPIIEFKKKLDNQLNYDIVEISGFTHNGIDDLLRVIFNRLADLPPIQAEQVEVFDFDVQKELTYKITKEDNEFIVEGSLVDDIVRGVNLEDFDSFTYFQNRIVDSGIEQALYDAGAKEGDTIYLGGVEFELKQ